MLSAVSPDSRAAPRRTSPLLVAALIFTLLVSVYSLTYSGVFKSDDEQLYVSYARSLGATGKRTAAAMYGVKGGATTEPGQALVGAVLYQLTRLGGIGTVHALFLQNIFVTSLTALVVFALVRQRGFRLETAALSALAFGLGTLAWPHSKLYFRDPLAMLLASASVWSFGAGLQRPPGGKSLRLWGLSALCSAAAVLSKTTAVAVVFALAVAAVVALASDPSTRRAFVMGLAGTAALGVLFALASPDVYRLMAARLTGIWQGVIGNPMTESFWPALAGLLVSPGKGVFLESPVLLLAALAIPATARTNKRLLVVPWLSLGVLTLVTARFQDYLWFGGTGWGVRHLLPVVPLLAAAGAPLLDKFFQPGRAPVKWMLAGLLAVSVLIQIGAAVALPADYYAWISPIAPDAAWNAAVWNPLYSEAAGYWVQIFSGRLPDLAWLRIMPVNRAPVLAVAITWAASAVTAALLLWRSLSVSIGRRAAALSWILTGAAAVLLPILMLKAYYPDPFYRYDRRDFRAAIDYLQQNARPADAIVVRGYLHPIWFAFLNYFHAPVQWYLVQAAIPSEAEVESLRLSQRPDRALGDMTQRLFTQELPGQYARVWTVTDDGAPGGGARLEEWWLSQLAVPVKTELIRSEGIVAVTLFALTSPGSAPIHPAAITYGSGIRLTGTALLPFAGRTVYHPGGILPVSLHWQVPERPQLDYNVGVYLLDEAGVLRAQQDGLAGFGFRSTSVWLPGQDILDNHGLELPAALAPGQYRLAVALYDWQTGQRLTAADPQGPLADNLALVADVTIASPQLQP